jgi:cytosine/adenosine deaminase-related metal-dependent hydrolase
VTAIRASWVYTPEGLRRDAVVELDDGWICAVRDAVVGDPRALEGVLIPGLVNAHTHLEIGGPLVTGGEGLPDWVARVMRRPRPGHHAPAAAVALHALGTAAVSDVSNSGETADALVAAGLQGVVQHELLTFDRARLVGRLEAARGGSTARDGVVTRPAPHAPYSTAPELIQACASPGPPASIHLAEDLAELAFLEGGVGPFAVLLDELGVDWRWWQPPGCGPVAYLDALGVLGPGTLAVHCTHVADLNRLARSGTPICVCPRSSLHIGGQLPDVGAMLAAGIAVCLGTDSLASSPTLDLLDEIPVLAHRWPDVPVATWLAMATRVGADVLGLAHLGRIAPGAAPGLVLLEGLASPDALTSRAPPQRHWILPARREAA